jgi:hypothetical protein
LTPNALAPFPTTDGGPFHLEGVPLVNYLTAPWYLFDPADTLDKVDHASLSAVSRAAFDIVRGTAGISAREMRCDGQSTTDSSPLIRSNSSESGAEHYERRRHI